MWTTITTTKKYKGRYDAKRFGKPEKRGDRFSVLHNEIKNMWSLHQKVRQKPMVTGRFYGPLDFVKKIISLTDSLRYDDWTLESGDTHIDVKRNRCFSIVRQIRVECGFIHLPIQFCQIHRLKTRKSATWNLETFRWCL